MCVGGQRRLEAGGVTARVLVHDVGLDRAVERGGQRVLVLAEGGEERIGRLPAHVVDGGGAVAAEAGEGERDRAALFVDQLGELDVEVQHRLVHRGRHLGQVAGQCEDLFLARTTACGP